jgi:hypothetical protein
MIKRITSIVAFAALFSSIQAQTTNVGGPMSFHDKVQLNSVKSFIEMPAFDLQAVMESNAANELNKVGPYMFGYEHQVNYDLSNSGTWTVLPNGDKIWRLKVKSDGALSLNFVFSDFFIPEGGSLHLYNDDKSHVVGAYTVANNNINNELGTGLLKGEEGVIEYFEPKEYVGEGRLLLTMIVHGYRDINNFYTEKALNDSDPCNMDVACPDGDLWEDEVRSVARIVNGGGVCTGTMLNNTAEDGTPYFLTANHCSPQGMGSFVFQFKYESPTCGSQTSSNSTAPTGSLNEVNGSVLRARKADSDFGLLELNAIPVNPYYSGWDNSGDIPQTATGIHHPRGDVKKLAFDDDILQSAQGLSSVANSEWQIEAWERNTTTEPASSGSGLWDQNHRMIGQLHGGQATCANSINDYYGKFSMSWDGNGSANSAERLSDWLDPQNSGVSTLDGWDPNAVTVAYDAALQSAGAITTLCSAQYTPEIKLKNNGTNTLSSATITYNVDGGTNQVFNWAGSIISGAFELVTLPTQNLVGAGAHTFDAVVSNPNGQPDGITANDNLNLNFNAVPNSMPMFLEIDLDCYGAEITWEVRVDGSTASLFNGGPYPNQAPTGLQVIEEFCLSNDCYNLEFFDSYGDGLAGAGAGSCTVDGDYNLNDYYGNNFVTMGADPDFGNGVVHNFCIATVGVDENALNKAIGIYPNPTSDILNIMNNDADINITSIEVVDALGAIILIETNITNGNHIVDLGNVSEGVYFMKLNTNEGVSIRKIIKK